MGRQKVVSVPWVSPTCEHIWEGQMPDPAAVATAAHLQGRTQPVPSLRRGSDITKSTWALGLKELGLNAGPCSTISYSVT